MKMSHAVILEETIGESDEVFFPGQSALKLACRRGKPDNTLVEVNGVRIGGGEIAVMAGPCSVESEEQLVSAARAVKASGAKILRGGAFKPRTSPYSFRGLEEEGLKLLALARQETGLPVVTELMDPRQLDLVCNYADILQLGSRNMQNYFLLEEVGRCRRALVLKTVTTHHLVCRLLLEKNVMKG